MPLGNGRLGAMQYGGAWADTIALNEESLVGGAPHDAREQSACFARRGGYLREAAAALRGGTNGSGAERAASKLACGGVASYEARIYSPRSSALAPLPARRTCALRSRRRCSRGFGSGSALGCSFRDRAMSRCEAQRRHLKHIPREAPTSRDPLVHR